MRQGFSVKLGYIICAFETYMLYKYYKVKIHQIGTSCFRMSFVTLARDRSYFAGSSSANPCTLETLECASCFWTENPKAEQCFFRGRNPQAKKIYPCIRWITQKGIKGTDL